jgi:hypothetical protein
MRLTQIAKPFIKLAMARTGKTSFDFLSCIGKMIGDAYNWTWYRC